MGLEAGAKSGLNALKAHWLFFLIVVLVLVGLAFKYDAKGGGKIRGWFTGLPVVGRFFA